MRASEIILNSPLFDNEPNRGEVRELLADLVFELYGSESIDDHLSNGGVVDAMLILFNMLITDNPEQEAELRTSIENLLEDE